MPFLSEAKAFFKKMLKRTLYWQVAFTVFAFAAMVIVSYFIMNTTIRNHLSRNSEAVLDLAIAQIDATLREPEPTLRIFAESVRQRILEGADTDNIREYLLSFNRYLAYHTKNETAPITLFGIFYTIGPEPVFLHSGGWTPPAGYDHRIRPWYHTAVAGGGNLVRSELYKDYSLEQYVFAITQSLWDESGRPLGVVSLQVPIDLIGEIVVKTAEAQGGYGMVLSQDLTVHAHANRRFVGMELPDPTLPFSIFYDSFLKGEDVFERPITSFAGETSLAFFRKTQDGWYYGTVVPSAPYYKSITNIWYTLVALGITAVAFLIFILVSTDARKNRVAALNDAKSRFLAAMSHEIRTPMNAILGITEIQMQNDLPTETKSALNIIYNSGYTLLGIINELLDLSKIEAGKLELVNARYETASLINDTVNLNTARIGSKPIEFKLHVDADMPLELIGDELRVKQILNNLLSNAFKYTAKGEVSLSLTTQIIGDEDAPHVKLTVIVSDTGQGMTVEQVRGMFDAYSRYNIKTNHFVEGTGLGMNIVQQLVNKTGGDISVNSVPEKGTEVTVHLMQGYVGPEKLGKELAENLKGFRTAGMSKMKKVQIVREYMPYGKVLVVDDMETNLYVARGFLLPYGLTVDTSLSGAEAVGRIERGDMYDIVFMDHMMPVMDGIETVKVIREKGYTRPIVALTANALSGQADPELAKVFTHDAEKALAVLQGYGTGPYEKDNLQPYIINAHALKSALANIRETNLSNLAKELEQAGRDKNIAFISKETPAFLSGMRTLVEKLKFGKAEDSGEVTGEDKAYLRKTLLAIKDACAGYDIDAAMATLNELKQKPWPGEYGELIDTISGHLLHSDFDEACAAYLSN
jgi:signal transduction histidine kinase/CheY-like chemotaxis protein